MKCTGEKNSEGEPHGQGTMTYADGSIYFGEWKDGKRHGKGLRTFPDCGEYFGEWKDDKRHGKGILRFPDGSAYTGEWKDDKRHGQGIEYDDDDDFTYTGEWKDGKCHGQGTMIYRDISKFTGEWKDGKCHGQGTMNYASGATAKAPTGTPMAPSAWASGRTAIRYHEAGGCGAVACGGAHRSAGAGAMDGCAAGHAGRACINRNRAGHGANRRIGAAADCLTRWVY